MSGDLTSPATAAPLSEGAQTVLVTGGLGFIGSHLIRHLLRVATVRTLIVLDERPFDSAHLASLIIPRNPRLRIVRGDVRDEALMRELLGVFDVDVTYHLAARTHVQESIREPRRYFETNGCGTLSVLEAARECHTRIIVASTSEVYGDSFGGYIGEASPCRPRSPYAASKAAADHIAFAYRSTYDMDVRILRFFNTFGPGQYFEKVVPMFICSALCDKDLPIQGDGTATREWIYIDDVCAALTQCLAIPAGEEGEVAVKDGAVHNFSVGQRLSVREVATKVIALSRKGHLGMTAFPDRPGQLRRQCAVRPTATNDLLQSRKNFDLGLRDTYAWYAARLDVWRPLFERDLPGILDTMSHPARARVADVSS